jgi:hypothetical protein
LAVVVTVAGCINNTGTRTTAELKPISASEAYGDTLNQLERKSMTLNYDSLGDLISTVRFDIKTNDLKDYKDGKIPYIRIDSPQVEIKDLIGKDEVVITQTTVTVVLDYPLTGAYQFQLVSPNGFTRAKLITEISKLYYQLYDEEEATATIKTTPMKDRKIYNRNQTNGKYGIWGHDIGDLVLDEIDVYRSKNGEIILTLQLES